MKAYSKSAIVICFVIALIGAAVFGCMPKEVKASDLSLLKAKEDIRDLITNYGWAIDNKDISLLMSLYTEDVHVGFPPRLDFKGAKQAEPFYLGLFSGQEVMRHKLINPYIEVEGEAAKGRVYYLTSLRDQKKGEGKIMEGLYKLKFTLVGGKWRISEIISYLAYAAPEPLLNRPLDWTQWNSIWP